MDQNVGASFGLSVLIVVFFAVVLYQPDPPPPSRATVPRPAPAAPAKALPSETPTAPAAVPNPTGAIVGERADAPSQPARVGSRTAPRAAEHDEPRGAFTLVRRGETLADVARRVYGTGDAAALLRRANRDLLDDPGAPIPDGSVLRTPESAPRTASDPRASGPSG